MSEETRPICHVVAGPNGSGKSTFALRYLPEYAGAVEYVNPDLMAQGMSPTDIRLSAIKAGKLTLERIVELIEARTGYRHFYARDKVIAVQEPVRPHAAGKVLANRHA